MEFYDGTDPDEVGVIEINGTTAIVLVVDDSAFRESQPMEVVEGAENVYVLVRRGVIDKAAQKLSGPELGREVMEAATSTLATWKLLSE